MSITIGIYDLFAYTVPGLLYLYVFNEIFRLFGLQYVDISRLDNFWHVLLIGIGAFVIGHLMENFSYKLCYSLLYRSKLWEVILKELKEKHLELDIQFKGSEWDMLHSILQHNDFELSHSVDKLEADSVMLHNIGLGLLLFAVLQIIIVVQYPFSSWSVVSAITAIILCVISFNRSVKFRRMFFRAIYQGALTYGTSLEEILRAGYMSRTITQKSETKRKNQSGGTRKSAVE